MGIVVRSTMQQIDDYTFSITSSSVIDLLHYVNVRDKSCTCNGFKYRRNCYHIDQVLLYIDDTGIIIPPSQFGDGYTLV